MTTRTFLFITAYSWLFPLSNPHSSHIPKARHAFIVIAHRGDHISFPENSLEAFNKAIKDNVDYVEMDLRTSKDSVLVIMHDETVDRTTNGKGTVASLRYSELKKLKINPTGESKGKIFLIPSFEETLRACKNKINIYLDFKEANVRQTYNLIQKYKMENQVIVYINKPQQFAEWKNVAPTIPLMVSLPDGVRSEKSLMDFLHQVPADLLDGDYEEYTPEMIKYADSIKIPCWPDIQGTHEMDNWNKAINMGLKGLQTDHPAQLIKFLEERSLR
jgi:glycerophosphoryl diester phosphodiesterase